MESERPAEPDHRSDRTPARLTVFLVAGIALAGIVLMILTVILIAVTRS